jgi:carbonic anhydrase
MQEISSSRREFIRRSGLAVGATGLALPAGALAVPANATAAVQPVAQRDTGAILAQLVEGNKRFAKGALTHPGRRPEDFAPLAEGQAPLAIIMGCADSRVAPELIFDQGVGDLFVVRVAGNVVGGAGPIVKGSIEFAVAVLGVRLIVVLGHSACGAVKAAIEHIDKNDTLPGSIRPLVDLIRPAAVAVRGKPGDKLENAIKANVAKGVERLKELDPILSEFVKKGELKVWRVGRRCPRIRHFRAPRPNSARGGPTECAYDLEAEAGPCRIKTHRTTPSDLVTDHDLKAGEPGRGPYCEDPGDFHR